MKNILFFLALLCSSSLVAQFSFNTNGSGIEKSNTTASGFDAFATGYLTQASGDFSTAMGNGTTTSGKYSTAIGGATTASGVYSTAMGGHTKASGSNSFTVGSFNESIGHNSATLGFSTMAEGFGSTAIGVNNKTNETSNSNQFSFLNTAFVIGNGAHLLNEGEIDGYYDFSTEYRSNAFEVLFDGTTTIAGDLNINSDARLKTNIISLGATLSKLLQIDGKTYTMKKDANHKKKIGLLAQDIEKVFPELVSETNDIKSVNYQGLVPVLINAMKEQQEEIDELKALVKQLLEK
jgi:hypothetical protein